LGRTPAQEDQVYGSSEILYGVLDVDFRFVGCTSAVGEKDARAAGGSRRLHVDVSVTDKVGSVQVHSKQVAGSVQKPWLRLTTRTVVFGGVRANQEGLNSTRVRFNRSQHPLVDPVQILG
jgi:hypothetical protein